MFEALTPLSFTLVVFAVSIVAGVVGSLLGLGGGIVVVPVLTLLLHVPMKYAVGASIVSIIATSSGAAAAYVRERMTNLRVAMLLELGTTTGAISGAYLAYVISTRWLFVIFGVVLGYSAVMMFHKRHSLAGEDAPYDAWAEKLNLHGAYYDQAERREIRYRVTHTKIGLAMMYVAGVISALLGIGSGSLKVPAMDLAMRLPIKVSTATSNFMIGVTAAASAGVYFARGWINPFIAAPVGVGILIGATGGSKLLGRLQSKWIRIAFVIVLLYVSEEMLRRGIVGGITRR